VAHLNSEVVLLAKKILGLFEGEGPYKELLGEDTKELIEGLLRHDVFGKDELGKAGRLLYLRALRYNLKVAAFLFEARMRGYGYSVKVTPEEIKRFYEAVDAFIRKQKTECEPKNSPENLAEEGRGGGGFHFGFDDSLLQFDDELFGLISGYLEKQFPEPMEIDVLTAFSLKPLQTWKLSRQGSWSH